LLEWDHPRRTSELDLRGIAKLRLSESESKQFWDFEPYLSAFPAEPDVEPRNQSSFALVFEPEPETCRTLEVPEGNLPGPMIDVSAVYEERHVEAGADLPAILGG
jgi:hypothetical protein